MALAQLDLDPTGFISVAVRAPVGAALNVPRNRAEAKLSPWFNPRAHTAWLTLKSASRRRTLASGLFAVGLVRNAIRLR